MKAQIASIAVSLLVAGAPAFAQRSNPAKPSKTAHSAAIEKPAAKNTASREKRAHDADLPAAYAAIPEAERFAIRSDLTWLGGYQDLSAEEIDARTVDSIRAFQKRNGAKETGVLTDQERALLADAVAAPKAAVGWRLIDDTATGARFGVPEKLVPRTSTARTGSRWTSALGQIQIETFRLHDASLPALFDQEKKASQRYVGYSVLNPDSFVITGEQKLKKFVERAALNGGEIRGVTILYDQATEGTMAPVALAVADSFEGFPDATTRSVTGRKRSVDYGTAIVVGGRGDLVAPGAVTAECQSITVPGFGHADRVAEDRTDDLALLRLYGARSLVPATLAGDSAAGGAVTLYGIADPLVQSGGGVPTSAAALLTAQGLDPPPKLGFSGAAALDAQGRFAGIVELKSPLVAGAGAVAPQAALIPAAAVRAFLQAQGIAPAAGHAAMEQSIVRIICVRK